ncbi:hypothetical protein CORC01_00014 [Colletotrichum orchidophilum]|uniref:Phosphoglycerate mutase n=1 Tax=Colletotrichum orchidophilum TaxID=1209926 RepID=A0A1G4BT30_9PEZI|nr:uncharacterized protein CORC01_00014 [Colletotrichum orchidophilum]OHF04543.1 hypothetical protein CORC01_00014 [Colletotrichum orchidophilum]
MSDKESQTPRVFFMRHGKLIDPARLLQVIVSPRLRAQRTLKLFLPICDAVDQSPEVIYTEDMAESKQQVTKRVDKVISQICAIQHPYMNGEGPADVLVVAHGTIIRCLWKRWIGKDLEYDLLTTLAPGATGILRCVDFENTMILVL